MIFKGGFSKFRPKNYKYIELFLETRDSKALHGHSLLILAGTRLEVYRAPLTTGPRLGVFPFLFYYSDATKQEVKTLNLGPAF